MLSLLLDSKMVCPFYSFEGAAQIRQVFRCKAGNTPCFRVEPSRVRFEMGETWLAVVNDLTSKPAEQMMVSIILDCGMPLRTSLDSSS